MKSGERIVREFIEAVGRADLSVAGRMMADHIVLHRCTDSQPSQNLDEGVDGLVSIVMDLAGGVSPHEVHDIVASDRHVVAIFTVFDPGQPTVSSRQRVNVYHVSEGLIVEVWVFESDPGDVHLDPNSADSWGVKAREA